MDLKCVVGSQHHITSSIHYFLSAHRKSCIFVIMPGVPCILCLLLLVLSWKFVCVYLRAKRSRYVASLDPTQDALLLFKLTNFVEFAFISLKALEFSLFRTFAIPSISKLLKGTQQFSPASVIKRYDDTHILFQEFVLNHVDSPRGSLAIRRLNFIHSQYDIANEDYLYTLSLFILEPIRFSSKYGYRKWTEGEKQSQFVVWLDIGTRMGIRYIPETLEEMERFNRQYEAQKMVYSDSNKVIGDATLDLLLSNAPAFLRPFGKRVVFALFDERLLDAMGYPRQPYWFVWTVKNMVWFCCGTLVRWILPPRPLGWATVRIPLEEGDANGDMVYRLRHDVYKPGTYPNGYRITELGNAKVGQVGEVGEGRLLCPFHC